MQICKNYINGQWLESASGEIIEVDDPSTGQIIGQVSCAKEDEVNMAVDAAREAHHSRILVDMYL